MSIKAYVLIVTDGKTKQVYGEIRRSEIAERTGDGPVTSSSRSSQQPAEYRLCSATRFARRRHQSTTSLVTFPE